MKLVIVAYLVLVALNKLFMKIICILFSFLFFNFMTYSQRLDFFQDKGLPGFRIGEKLKSDSLLYPISLHTERENIILDPTSSFSFFFYSGYNNIFIADGVIIREVFIVTDINSTIESVTVYLLDSTSKYHLILDKIYGSKKVQAESFITGKKNDYKSLWDTNKGIEVFLSEKSLGINFIGMEIQIYNCNLNVSSTEMSIFYPSIFDK